jgi:hypothetical protein
MFFLIGLAAFVLAFTQTSGLVVTAYLQYPV